MVNSLWQNLGEYMHREKEYIIHQHYSYSQYLNNTPPNKISVMHTKKWEGIQRHSAIILQKKIVTNVKYSNRIVAT